ncbi:MAG: c-type cytochrome [Actinobacteria bacterium]|nr:c-type cytochrome [Actinomycetota bacterium]
MHYGEVVAPFHPSGRTRALACIIGAALAACGDAPAGVAFARPSPERLAEGQALYAQHCAACHGVDTQRHGPGTALSARLLCAQPPWRGGLPPSRHPGDARAPLAVRRHAARARRNRCPGEGHRGVRAFPTGRRRYPLTRGRARVRRHASLRTA